MYRSDGAPGGILSYRFGQKRGKSVTYRSNTDHIHINIEPYNVPYSIEPIRYPLGRATTVFQIRQHEHVV